MKKSLEIVLFLDFTRKNTAFALRTPEWMGNHHQNKTRRDARKKANTGTGTTTHQKASAKPNGQNRKAGEMNRSRQLWIPSDRVVSPFLILFVIICRLRFELENDPFHMTMRVMLNDPAHRRGRRLTSEFEIDVLRPRSVERPR